MTVDTRCGRAVVFHFLANVEICGLYSKGHDMRTRFVFTSRQREKCDRGTCKWYNGKLIFLGSHLLNIHVVYPSLPDTG